MNARQKQIKEARQKIKQYKSNANKNLLIVSVLPVIADFIQDLDLEESEVYKNVYDAIRVIDESVTNRQEYQSDSDYQSAIDAQIAIQIEFRKFFIDFCKTSHD